MSAPQEELARAERHLREMARELRDATDRLDEAQKDFSLAVRWVDEAEMRMPRDAEKSARAREGKELP